MAPYGMLIYLYATLSCLLLDPPFWAFDRIGGSLNWVLCYMRRWASRWQSYVPSDSSGPLVLVFRVGSRCSLARFFGLLQSWGLTGGKVSGKRLCHQCPTYLCWWHSHQFLSHMLFSPVPLVLLSLGVGGLLLESVHGRLDVGRIVEVRCRRRVDGSKVGVVGV